MVQCVRQSAVRSSRLGLVQHGGNAVVVQESCERLLGLVQHVRQSAVKDTHSFPAHGEQFLLLFLLQ